MGVDEGDRPGILISVIFQRNEFAPKEQNLAPKEQILFFKSRPIFVSLPTSWEANKKSHKCMTLQKWEKKT